MLLSTACLCCTALTCIFQQRSLIRISWGTWSDPASLIHVWAAWLIWMLLQWNTGQSSCCFLVVGFFGVFLGLFHSGKNAVVVSMVVLPTLQMHLLACPGFLAPSGFPRISSIYVLLKPMEELSLYYATLSGWLSWNCMALVWWFCWLFWSLCSAYGRKRLSASFFLFFKNLLFKYFSSVFFAFLRNLQGGGKKL